MPIMPLPVFEADAQPHHRAAMSDEEIYARLEPPKTIVVRFGLMKLVGEYPYDGDAKPGCGSRLVARTHRGTELVEMLTTTCSNSGCSKSISRHEMLDYIDNSGGRDFPFHTRGRILRVATIDDLNQHSALETVRREAVKACKELIAALRMSMKLVEAEPILGGEQLTFYYMAEHRVDFRELVQRLASQLRTRIEMRQVGARDEARLVADYERCGQHCCCKNFLKVLKPVSMRAAKVQKATLDPLKISGRCGRLMCCLRYEDQTYKELKSKLPPKNKHVGTMEGPGVVIETKILVQLALIRLEHDGKEIAVPIEELMDPETCPRPGETAKRREAEAQQPREDDPFRGLSESQVRQRIGEPRDGGGGKTAAGGNNPRTTRSAKAPGGATDGAVKNVEAGSEQAESEKGERGESEGAAGRRRRRGRRRSNQQKQDAFRERSQQEHEQEDSASHPPSSPPSAEASASQPSPEGKRRRRKRRKRKGGGDRPAPGSDGPST